MEKFTIHRGKAAPLRRSDVDTDQIVPAEYLKRVTRTGFADGCFAAWRADSNFVLNRPEHQDASVLLAGPNFGTGSSREHAVWALQDYGFTAVLSSRFADIFRGNAGKAGLLAAEVSQEDIEVLWEAVEADPHLELTVDLHERVVTAGDHVVAFEIDDYTRWRLLEGLDDIGLTMRQVEEITTFERGRPAFLPQTLGQGGY